MVADSTAISDPCQSDESSDAEAKDLAEKLWRQTRGRAFRAAAQMALWTLPERGESHKRKAIALNCVRLRSRAPEGSAADSQVRLRSQRPWRATVKNAGALPEGSMSQAARLRGLARHPPPNTKGVCAVNLTGRPLWVPPRCQVFQARQRTAN